MYPPVALKGYHMGLLGGLQTALDAMAHRSWGSLFLLGFKWFQKRLSLRMLFSTLNFYIGAVLLDQKLCITLFLN